MIEKLIFWNIRSINTQKSFERLLDLNHRHHYSFIALMEPFQNPSELEQYKRRLGFDKAGVNQNGKILCFWKDDWVGNIVLDTVQQVTFQFKTNDKEFMISVVYAGAMQ